MHSKLKTLARAGRDGLQKAYNQCRTHKEKRVFFYDKYLLDPEVSEKTVLKKDTQESVVTEDNIDDWFAAEQVAKFKGIEPGVENFKELVKASVKDLPERDYEDENLAALGLKQYHYQTTKTKTQTLKRKGLELQEQVGEVSTEDFTDMRAAMNPSTGQRMIGSSSSKQQKQIGDRESSLQKATELNLEVNWTQAYKDNQKKCKSSLGSMAAELHNCDTLLGKIAALPDASEMKPFLQKQVQAQKQCLEEEKKSSSLSTCPFPRLARMRLKRKRSRMACLPWLPTWLPSSKPGRRSSLHTRISWSRRLEATAPLWCLGGCLHKAHSCCLFSQLLAPAAQRFAVYCGAAFAAWKKSWLLGGEVSKATSPLLC